MQAPCASGAEHDLNGRGARADRHAPWVDVDGARVLLVEDDLALRDVVARGLREAGLAVVTAGDGTSAVRTVGAGPQVPFDVIVLDIGLPDSDGRDVCQALRARGVDVPVLFLTARDQLHDVLSGFAAGGDDHMGKPFHVSELLARVGAMVRRGRRRPSPEPRTLRLDRSEEHTSELQSRQYLVCRLLLEKKKKNRT